MTQRLLLEALTNRLGMTSIFCYQIGPLTIELRIEDVTDDPYKPAPSMK
jgi:hypothetical protein